MSHICLTPNDFILKNPTPKCHRQWINVFLIVKRVEKEKYVIFRLGRDKGRFDFDLRVKKLFNQIKICKYHA